VVGQEVVGGAGCDRGEIRRGGEGVAVAGVWRHAAMASQEGILVMAQGEAAVAEGD